MQSHTCTAYSVLETRVFSWRERTVSPPRLSSPTLKAFMGGAVASDRVDRASADMWGHLSMEMAPEATFMAKAMQVGLPQSLQLVLTRI